MDVEARTGTPQTALGDPDHSAGMFAEIATSKLDRIALALQHIKERVLPVRQKRMSKRCRPSRGSVNVTSGNQSERAGSR